MKRISNLLLQNVYSVLSNTVFCPYPTIVILSSRNLLPGVTEHSSKQETRPSKLTFFLNLRTTFCKKNNAWLHYKPRSNRKFIMGKCKRLEVSYFQKSGKTATLFLGQNAAECLNVKRPLEREHFFCLSANDSFLLKKICCRLGISGRRPQTWNRLFLLNVL